MFYHVWNYVREFCADLNQTGWFKELCPNYVLLCFIMSGNYVRIMFYYVLLCPELCFIMFYYVLLCPNYVLLCFFMFFYVRTGTTRTSDRPLGLTGSNQEI